jgi:predicted phage terminase large subunit-like protein
VADFFAARMPLTDHYSAGGFLEEAGFVREVESRMRVRPGARAVMYTGKDEDLVLDLLGKAEDHRIYVEARRAVTDKRERATGAATAWNRGLILIPRDAPWADAFCEHVVGFTGADGAEDEEVDTLAAAFDALSEGDGVGIVPPRVSTRGRRLSLGRKMYT